MNKLFSLTSITTIALLFALSATNLHAQYNSPLFGNPESGSHEKIHENFKSGNIGSEQSGFLSSLKQGKIVLNNRLRSELVQTEQLNNALAITNRLQLGYETKPWYGFSVFADFVDVRPIGPDRYNAAGLNNRPNYALIADPRMTVLNQLYGQIREESLDLLVRIGRQRIIQW